MTLGDAASLSIQTAPETDGAVLTGTFQAAGTLSYFIGSPVDGNWTLYVADESSGGGTSQLNSWSVAATPSATPEPGTFSLIAAAGLLGLCGRRLGAENSPAARVAEAVAQRQ